LKLPSRAIDGRPRREEIIAMTAGGSGLKECRAPKVVGKTSNVKLKIDSKALAD
jgi:hypothetical protein